MGTKSSGRYPKGGGLGLRIDSYGYYRFTHRHSANFGKHVHRVVMEEKIGRKLRHGESVHHINGDRLDNRPENLELWTMNHGPGVRVKDMDIWSGTIPPYQHGAL